MVCFAVWLLPLLAMACIARPAGAADASIEATIEGVRPDVEAYIGNGMKMFDLPGLSIGIIANDRTVYSRGFGVRSKAGSAPVDTRTVFQIGSATKGFLSARWR